MKDIRFKTEDSVFSYRVGGLLIQNNKILLQRPNNDDFSIIGGHVSFMETTSDTLIREFQEEIHTNIIVDQLMAVGEIFFPCGNQQWHQICFYYKIHLADDSTIPLEGSFYGYDEFDHKRINLEFCWVPLEELRNGLKVYPLELIPHILNPSDELIHFVSIDN